MRTLRAFFIGTLLVGSAAAGQKPKEPTVAAMGFKALDLDEKKAVFYSDYFAQQFADASGLHVTSSSEIAALVGIERQKQLLGCSDAASSCVAEIANALGSDVLITGSVARVAGKFAVSIKLVNARDGQSLGGSAATIGREDELLEWLTATARKLGPKVAAELRPPGSAPVTLESSAVSTSGSGSKAWIPAVAGGVLLAAGATFAVMANLEHGKVYGPNSPIADVNDVEGAVSRGQQDQLFAIIGLSAGAVALGVAGVMALTHKDEGVTLAPMVGSANGFALGGSF